MRILEARSPLALEQNLALLAGAGAGKTYSLVTLCLHLLGGARSDLQPVRPHQLFMLTFTDKAAAEMRARLRQRLDLLATGIARDTDEADLRASFHQLDRPFPPPDFWRRVRDDLGSATIGTFHSLCVQLLRRAPAGFGVDPAFELLEERAAAGLIRDAAERVVLEALSGGDEVVAELCRELNFAAVERGSGLVDSLCSAFTKVREEGLDPASLAIGDERAARAAFEQAVGQLQRAAGEASAADLAHGKGKYAEAISLAQAALEGMTFENFLEPGRWLRLADAVASYRVPPKGAHKESLQALKHGAVGADKQPGLRDFYAGVLVVKHEQAFRTLLAALEARHRDELHKRGVLDFSALLIRTRDLLRDHPTVRKEVQERMRGLLVDEFQDTNRLQLELVTMLAERRDGAPRVIAAPTELEALPLEPAFLCAVGDRKQSIYEFRGADVSVFGALAERIVEGGGVRHYLKRNWRSTPGLLTFFNRLFAGVMAPPEDVRDYEVVYEPAGDDLEPVRAELVPPPCVDRLLYDPGDDAEQAREQDAEAIARRIHQLLAPASTEQIAGRDGVLRRARGGDVAILLRRFTHLEVYRQALARAQIPHRVVRGRGFYGAQEVLDVASLLALVADPKDALSFAAVLRSPLVGLSDASLFRLALGGKRPLTILSVLGADEATFAPLSDDERGRLRAFLALYPRLRAERDRLGIRVMIKVALDELGYRVAVAGTAYGEQALGNLDKLLELAGRWDEANTGDLAAFAHDVLALADGNPNEAQADVLDAEDDRAVHVMTIHQAKGLEWPIVVVPDLAAGPNRNRERVLLDRERGLAMRPFVPEDPESASSPRFKDFQRERARRDDAEFRRLLYVALTRARDRLVLSGQGRTAGTSTWRKWIDQQLEGSEALRVLVRDLRLEELPDPVARPALEAAAPADARERISAATARVRTPVPLGPSAVVLPVTHLQDFFLCPRRYLYAHQVGLSEYPIMLELDRDPEDLGDGKSPQDRRLRGTLAHKLLEQVDLSLGPGKAQDAQLSELLWAEGLSPKEKDALELLAWVKGFLATPFAQKLAAAGPHRVHRELPFLLRLGGRDGGLAVHLKGQIDLLFEDDDGGATVIDYKASQRRPGGLDSYAFQLDCYALAARQLVQDGVAIRTGIAFLREEDPGPDFRAPSDGGHLEGFEDRLVRAAEQLLAASRGYDWPGREPSGCAAIRCGYRYRCHPATPEL